MIPSERKAEPVLTQRPLYLFIPTLTILKHPRNTNMLIRGALFGGGLSGVSWFPGWLFSFLSDPSECVWEDLFLPEEEKKGHGPGWGCTG